MKKSFLSLLLVIILSGLSQASLLKNDRILTVSGTGRVETVPDRVSVRLGVELLRKTVQEAQNDNAAAMDKVMAAIKKLNIPADRIATSNFNLWPEMKYENDQSPKLAGYHCSNQISIDLDDVKLVSRVIDAGVSAGANNILGLQFSRKDDLEAKKSALEKAVKEARSKAEALAAAAGVKLKDIVNINEGGAYAPAMESDSMVRSMALNAAPAAATPISPGTLSIQENVTVNYIIE
ncbi:MAG TPA: SIMPL domain-containing protein [Candidatus Omnitrophota bacterium]|nr:SIMPL domain-containing protein [Candidatus Omnitrophota bacterium]